MGKDRVFCSFCLGTVFFFSFDHTEGWKASIFEPHEKKIPVFLNYSQVGAKTSLQLSFIFNIWPCLSFSFFEGGGGHMLRDHQRVQSLMLDLFKDEWGWEKENTLPCQGICFSRNCFKTSQSPKHLRGFFSSVCDLEDHPMTWIRA